jgi:hypothetical protein
VVAERGRLRAVEDGTEGAGGVSAITSASAHLEATLSERDLQTNILSLAAALGWLCYHTHDSRRSAAGFPDLVLVKGDRLIFAELKSARGKLSKAQSDWFVALGRVAQVYVWRPSDWFDGLVALALGAQ